MNAEVLPDNLVRAGFLADGEDGQVDPGAIVVAWDRPTDAPDGAVQVYVNGQLAAVCDDPARREMVAPADSGDTLAVALIATDVASADGDHAGLLTPQQRGSRALLRWPRLAAAGSEASVEIFGNGGGGEIDFQTPLSDRPIDWFANSAGRWGFGLCSQGEGGFGYDAAQALGLGRGAFGIGEWGFDADWLSWLSEPLAAGEHRLAAVARDRLGNAVADPPEAAVTIVEPPPRVAEMSISQDTGGRLSLAWQTL
ncbi:MAG: hypothetical protein BIFFINMI_02919 [Phycisphaerae bacterium]|nr:hypothetical protein [Phycisphaerae bacterium]